MSADPLPPVALEPESPNIETVGRRVVVRETFVVYDRTHRRVFHVPAGFRHDGASIPRAIGWLIAHDDCGEVAPAVHDYLYRTGGLNGLYPRAHADELFRELMRLAGVASWKREAAYRAVRLFGGTGWHPAEAR